MYLFWVIDYEEVDSIDHHCLGGLCSLVINQVRTWKDWVRTRWHSRSFKSRRTRLFPLHISRWHVLLVVLICRQTFRCNRVSPLGVSHLHTVSHHLLAVPIVSGFFLDNVKKTFPYWPIDHHLRADSRLPRHKIFDHNAKHSCHCTHRLLPHIHT